MPLITGSIELKDSELPLLTQTVITQQGIEKNLDDISFIRLIALKTVLASVDVPPNPETLKIANTLHVSNLLGTQTLELNNNQINIQSTDAINPTTICIQGDFTPPNTSNIVITDNSQYYNASTKNQIAIGDLTNNYSINIDASIPKINVTDNVNNSVLTNTSISFADATNNSTILSGTQLLINDGSTTYYSQLQYDKLKISDSFGIKTQSEFTSQSILMTTLDGTNKSVSIDNGYSSGFINISLEDGINTGIFRNDFLQLINNSSGNYYSFNTDTLQIDNTTNPSYIRMNAYDGLKIQNDTKSGTPTSTNTFTHSNISIDNALGSGPTNTLTAGDMTINDFGSTYVSQITSDYAQFTTPAYTTQLTASSLIITYTPDNYYTNVSAGTILCNDTNGGNPIQIELVPDHTQHPDPFIRLQNDTGLNNYLRFKGIYADGHFCFNLNNDQKFFKQQNPFSMTQTELLDGEYIEKYMPFVFAQNVTGLKLRNYVEYLDDNGLVGWSCIVSNYSGAGITIDTNGLNWYSHSSGLNTNPIQMKKWATCRLTLVYSSIDNEYLWAFSEF